VDHELTEVLIPDPEAPGGGTTIIGLTIADKSTWGLDDTAPRGVQRPRPRWSHQRVFKLESGRYVLVREAYSLIYHALDTRCTIAGGEQSGVPVTRELMFSMARALGYTEDDLVACEECLPPYPEELRAGQQVRYEVPRPSIDRCEEPGQVKDRLTKRKRRGGMQSSTMSPTSRELLRQCAVNDPDWVLSDQPKAVIR
jgi:hypothetical protein